MGCRHPSLTTLLLAGLLWSVSACRTAAPPAASGLVDADATRETRALFVNLQRIAPDHVLFGHQDALASGVRWKGEEGRSDVRDVTGSYPAVYGWDVGGLETGAEENLYGIRFEDMKRWIEAGYERGGVITISWHMSNPVTGGTAWDTTAAVPSVLPGGEHHGWYVAALDRFAGFIDDLDGGGGLFPGSGRSVPVIFRPFHDVTGGWFWWARESTAPGDFIDLWRFTVSYLRDDKGLHNLLYAYSTDVFFSETDYLEYYPGDAYVDVMGLDDFADVRCDRGAADLTRRLGMLVRLADRHGKLAALTETGREGLPSETWWTDCLLAGLTSDPVARRIAYVLVWRNAYDEDRPGHFFVPYPGHPASPDFVRFFEDPYVLFGSELPDLYRIQPPLP